MLSTFQEQANVLKPRSCQYLTSFHFFERISIFPLTMVKTLDLAVSTLCLEPVQALDFLQPQSAHHDPGLLMLDNYLVTVTKLSSDHTCLGVLV